MMFPPIIQWAPQPVRTNQDVSFFDNSRSAYQFYQWRVDGTLLSQQKALTHRFTSSGDHTVNLVVSGVGGSKDSATVRFTVLEGERPEPLVPDFVFAPASPEPGQSVRFLGRSTGKPVAYSWQVEGREVTNTVDAEFAFPREGTFGVRFVVSDASGNSAEKTQSVSVAEPKVIVAFEASSKTYSGQATRFVNTTEGRVNSFEWDFGDGSTDNDRNPTHTYQNDGTSEKDFTVVLRARTSLGKMLQSKPATVHVLPTVKAPAPVAAFRILGEHFKVGTRIEFVDESTGLVSTYAWDFNGEGTSMGKNPGFGFETPGNKSVQLKVRGPDGGESVVAKTLTVQPREQSIDAHWLDERGQNCVPPKEISFDEVAIQHVKNGQYPRPQFTTFEIILPPDLPAGGGAGLTVEGKVASAFELVRLLPGSDQVAPVAPFDLITNSGRFRVDIRPQAGEGEYTGEIVIRPLGQNVLVNKLANPLAVPVKITIAKPGGGGVFLIFLLLAAAAFLVWWFVVRRREIPPGQLMVVDLTELAGEVKDKQNAPLARNTFELRMGENISLGRDGKEEPSAKIFDLGAPTQYLIRQQKGLELRHRDGARPKMLGLSGQFAVAGPSGRKRQVKVTATAKPKSKLKHATPKR
jgi:PKD repeat protein